MTYLTARPLKRLPTVSAMRGYWSRSCATKFHGFNAGIDSTIQPENYAIGVLEGDDYST